MKTTTAPVALALVLLATAANAAPPPGNSLPVAPQLDNATPLPQDTPWPGGTIGLDIDATDTLRKIYRVTQTIPVAAGTDELVLLLPEWLPGKHAARGSISQVSDIRFFADGKPLAWSRDNLDVYQFRVKLPAGTRAVTAKFVHTSPVTSGEGRVTMTPEMLNLQWESMSLYPAGHYTRRIEIAPTVKFPAGWQVFTALDGMTRDGDTVRWATTDYETLVDSPIFAGKHAKEFILDPKVRIGAVADEAKQLDIKPENLKAFERLVDEADALFGARHFDHYTTLLAMTERMGGIGLEHHRSSENQYEPDALVKWDEMDWDRNVVAHELVHSWNGKFRRPEGLWTPDYRTPMQDDLLWVYEGQTQFWGWILAARSGLQSKDTILGTIAVTAANYAEGQPGRDWRSVQDTTFDPIISARRPLPYSSLSRAEDYYAEGAMVWLEADQIIRAGTKGKKGLDDFARAFFGKTDGDWGVMTYDFDEVAATLNAVYPYDWAKFLDTRLRQPGQPAPLGGLEKAGYKLVWKDTPNPYEKGRMASAKGFSLWYSLGASFNNEGKVTSVLWDGPAFDAGIVSGSQVVAVNGTAFSKERLEEAITAAKDGKDPIQLLVKRGDQYDTIAIDYHAGLRYAWIEPVAKGTQGLDRLLAPKAR